MKPQDTATVVISPYRAANGRTVADHVAHAEMLCRRLAIAGYPLFASHLFATRFLDDRIEREREAGITISKGWIARADRLAVWDLWGISSGMKAEIDWAATINKIRINEEERMWKEGIHGVVSPLKPILVHFASRNEVVEWTELVELEGWR